MGKTRYVAVLQIAVLLEQEDLDRSKVRGEAIKQIFLNPEKYSEGFDLIAADTITGRDSLHEKP